MKEWKYLIGSADDFIGAPDWATLRTVGDSGIYFFVEAHAPGMRAVAADGLESTITQQQDIWPEIIAQRTESFGNAIDMEFCKANPDHPDCKCKEQSSRYSRPCKGITVDVYDVLQAFAVTNPATQHAIKKLLCAGLRGHKDKMQDLTEALKSIERAIELEKE